jgi:hypothetical protein
MKQFDFSNGRFQQALTKSVCDMGQFTHEEKLLLERAVRLGYLSKGKGGPYPLLKTVYAHPGFDFARDREKGVAELMRAHMLDIARGTTKHFPMVKFQ